MGRQRTISMVAIIIVCAQAWLTAAWAADSEAPKTPLLEVYQLKHLDAKMVAENLDRLLQHRRDIKVAVDSKANTLILFGAQNDHETLRAFLTLVDQPVERGGTGAKPTPSARGHVPTDRASKRFSEEEVAKMSELELRKFVSDLEKRVARLEKNLTPRTIPLVGDSKLEK
jgi:hypothetical protein